MQIFESFQGEIYALLTAIFWTITAIAFESASLKVGSLAVNVIRLFIGLIFLSFFTWLNRGLLFPTDATTFNWFWLGLSGFIGFVFGDLFLFKSYTLISSRYAMLIMSLVPPLAAFFGWLILGETLRLKSLTGMSITLAGILMTVFSRTPHNGRLSLKLAPKGLLFAFGGALGQALGLVISKYGMKGYSPFAATQIRILAGIIGFTFLVTVLGRWKKVFKALLNFRAMTGITIGSFFGPFLGVSFSLLSIIYTSAGIASTIMSIVPVLIIVPSIIIFKQKVSLIEVTGAIISVIGVSIFFIS